MGSSFGRVGIILLIVTIFLVHFLKEETSEQSFVKKDITFLSFSYQSLSGKENLQ